MRINTTRELKGEDNNTTIKLKENEICLDSNTDCYSLTAPLKQMGGGVTMSLSLRKRKREEVKPLVKISVH